MTEGESPRLEDGVGDTRILQNPPLRMRGFDRPPLFQCGQGGVYDEGSLSVLSRNLVIIVVPELGLRSFGGVVREAKVSRSGSRRVLLHFARTSGGTGDGRCARDRRRRRPWTRLASHRRRGRWPLVRIAPRSGGGRAPWRRRARAPRLWGRRLILACGVGSRLRLSRRRRGRRRRRPGRDGAHGRTPRGTAENLVSRGSTRCSSHHAREWVFGDRVRRRRWRRPSEGRAHGRTPRGTAESLSLRGDTRHARVLASPGRASSRRRRDGGDRAWRRGRWRRRDVVKIFVP